MATNEPPPVPPGPLPPPQYAPPPTSPTPARWRSLQGPKNVLIAALVVNAIAAAVAIVMLARRLSIFSEFERNGGSLDLGRRDADAANNVQSIAITMAILLLVTLILFIIWMWRAAKNNEALGRQQPRFGPTWAIWVWIIPLANFVIPVLIMQDLWRGSNSSIPRGDARWRIADRSAFIGWWWGLLIASRLSVAIFNGDSHKGLTISQLRTNVNLAIVSCLLSIAAVVLAVLVVRRLTERQNECLRVQQGEWSQQQGGAPAPPG